MLCRIAYIMTGRPLQAPIVGRDYPDGPRDVILAEMPVIHMPWFQTPTPRKSMAVLSSMEGQLNWSNQNGALCD